MRLGDNLHLTEQIELSLPTYRFGRLESPLMTLARSAGFASWSDLVSYVRNVATVSAQAPEICGRSIGNALLIRDGCEHFGISVIDVVSSEQQEFLVLAPINETSSPDSHGRLAVPVA